MSTNVMGGFAYLDMASINKDFTSNTGVTVTGEKAAEIVEKVSQTAKPLFICNLHAHASTTHYGTYQPFIPNPWVKDTGTSGHVKWTSTNIVNKTLNDTVVILVDQTTATGDVSVKVTCSTASPAKS